MSLHDLAAGLVGHADHRALGDVGVGQQRGLHLRAGDVVAAGDDHVVAAGGEVEVAVVVLHEGVAGEVPAVLHVAALAVIGEVAAAGGALHRQPANGAAGHLVHVVVHHPGPVAADGPPGATRTGVVEAVGDEDVQQFGGANAVEHRLAGGGHPCVVHRGGQGLARGHGGPQRRQVGTVRHRGEHRPVGRGGGEAHRRPVLLDDLDEVRWRRVLQQGGGGAEPQREHGEAAEAEREGQGRRADEHVVGRDPEHLLGVAVGDDQQVAMEVHCRLRPPRGAAREPQQGHVVAADRRRFVAHRLVQRHPVQFGVVVGGAVEPDDLGEEAALLGARHQLVHQPGVAQRQRDLGDVDDLAQLAGPQHRHRVHHHRAGLRGCQPAGHHRRVVGGADQHPVARHHPVVLRQRVGQPVCPVGELLVGAAPAVADEGGVVAEAALHHPVRQLDCSVEVLRVVEAVEQQFRPLLGRRQVVAGERVHVPGGAERGVHGTTAVASISTFARASISATTCTTAMAGKWRPITSR